MPRFFVLALGLVIGGWSFPLWGGVYYFDLSAAANRGPQESFENSFLNAEDLEQKNGLKDFPTGVQTFRGVPFQLLDPVKNHGYSFIALKGRPRPDFPVSIELKGSHKAAFLYFLQTCHWGGTASQIPVAQYLITYDDRQTITIPLRVGQEFTNFWGADDTAESYLAWWYRYKNSSMGVNLFAWNNPRPDHVIQSITFQSLSKMPVPLLFGVTASDQALVISPVSPKPEPTSVTDTTKWIPLVPPDDSISPVLDPAFLPEVPAGKHGPVTVQGGKLIFTDGTPARFWGVRLSPTLLSLDAAGVEKLADSLTSQGFNLVILDLGRAVSEMQDPDDSNAVLSTKYEQLLHQKGEAVSLFVSDLTQKGIYISFTDFSLPLGSSQKATITIQDKAFTGDPTIVPPGLFQAGFAEWNPPTVQTTPPLIVQNSPQITQPENSLPSQLIQQRQFGQPFLGFWSEGWPQSYLAETPLLMSALADFQGWDGCVGEEAGSGGAVSQAMPLGMDWTTNPLLYLQGPAVSLAFRRGDLKEGKIFVPSDQDPGQEFESLAHQSGKGSLKTDPLGLAKAKVQEKLKSFVSDSGQIHWQGNVGVVQIDAPRFQAALGFLGHRQIKSPSWEVETPNLFTVLSMISLTNKPTLVSNHLLITGVTRMENSGMVYNIDQTKVISVGKGPVLMEPLDAKVTICRLAKDSALKIRALDAFGTAIKAKVPFRWKGTDLLVSWVSGAVYLEVFK